MAESQLAKDPLQAQGKAHKDGPRRKGETLAELFEWQRRKKSFPFAKAQHDTQVWRACSYEGINSSASSF